MKIPSAGQFTPAAASKLIMDGVAPENMSVSGPLAISKWTPERMPDGLTAPSVNLNCPSLKELPARLTAWRVTVRSEQLKTIGAGMRCNVLDLQRTAIETLPADTAVRQRIDLSGCRQLSSLPDNLTTGSLVLAGCVSLKELPRGLRVAFLDLSGCTSLRRLPDDLCLGGGHLILRDCQWLTQLPEHRGALAGLDLSGCLNVTRIPEGLKVASWIDLAGTGVTALPVGLGDVGLRWRGIPVSRRVVFEPHTLTAEEILGERNAELRRVMMERFGYERLLEAASAVELDRDQDAGGVRRLLRIPLEGDEDLVCVSVQCPSTGHKFILRVPPAMRTCRQAVAWTAGYDNPDDYQPAVET